MSKFILGNVVQLYYETFEEYDLIGIEIDDEVVSLEKLKWKHLSHKAEFYELVFQIMMSICTKISKIV